MKKQCPICKGWFEMHGNQKRCLPCWWEERLEHSRRYYWKHREKELARNAVWRANHPEKVRENKARQTAKFRLLRQLEKEQKA